MRSYHFLVLCLFAAISGFGQGQHQLPTMHGPALNRDVRRILSAQAGGTAEKGTAIKERIIAQSWYEDYGGGAVQMIDTQWYKYSGIHGNKLSNGDFSSYFDGGSSYIWDGLADANYSTLMYDTASTTFYSSGGPYEIRTVKQYNAQDYLSKYDMLYPTYPGSNAMAGQTLYEYTYDGQHNCMQSVEKMDTSSLVNGSFLPIDMLGASFSNNKKYQDSIYDFTISGPDSRQLYTYNTNGLLTQRVAQKWTNSGWLSDSMDVYTYDNNNRLSIMVSKAWDVNTSTYVSSTKDSFGYAGTNALYNYAQHWYIYGGIWQQAWVYKGTINSIGAWDTLRSYNYSGGTWTPAGYLTYTYTSLGHISTMDEYSTGAHISKCTFYYQQYNDPTAVPATRNSDNKATIFPNPAGASIYISFNRRQVGDVTVSLISMSGQIVQRNVLALSNNEISVANLAPGVYIAELNDDNTVPHIRFVKQ